jgi:fatty acid desaturase
MSVTTALLIVQWRIGTIQPLIYALYLFLSIAVTVIAHNHNHVPIWRSKTLNSLTDHWLTVFFGFPAFAWIPTHNMNHHTLNNREDDYTKTYRFTEQNTLLMLVLFPMISSYYQQGPIAKYLKNLWKTDRNKFYLSISQYGILIGYVVAALILDWKKALFFIIIPQQFGMFFVLVYNYVQHVHADEESAWDHSRNFRGLLNFVLFNNGYHTVHHERSGIHWSKTPEEHKKIVHLITPSLNERSFTWYMFRVYFLGAFNSRFRTTSFRLERIKRKALALEQAASNEQAAVTL